MPKNYGDLVKVTVWSRDRESLAKIQDRFNLDNRATANNYVIGLAQSLIDAAGKLNITPEALIEKLDEAQSNAEMPTSTSEIDPTTEAVEPEQLSLPSVEDRPSHKPTSEDKSCAKRSRQAGSRSLGQIPTDPSNLLISNMNTQQQTLSNLTTAIYDLIKVIKFSSIVTTPEHQPSSTSNTNGRSSDVASPQTQKTSKSPTSSDLNNQLTDAHLQAGKHSASLKDAELVTSEKEKPPSKPKTRSDKVRARINRCIDAIMTFNNIPHRPHGDKWAISVAILRQLAGCGQSAAYAVYNSRKDEIEAHNQSHQLDYLHNRKGQDSPHIQEVIHIS